MARLVKQDNQKQLKTTEEDEMNLSKCAKKLIVPSLLALLAGGMAPHVANAEPENVSVAEMMNAYACLLNALSKCNLDAADAEVARMQARQIKLQGDWQEVEVEELRRLTRQLRRDQWRARRLIESMQDRAEALSAFFSGQMSTSNYNAFRWATGHLPVSKSHRAFLSAEIAALPSEAFVSEMRLFDTLNPDGSLKEIPVALRRDDPNHPIEKARVAFVATWNEILSSLKYSESLSYERVTRLEESLGAWQRAATPTGKRVGFALWQQLDFLKDLRCLVRALYSPVKVELLRRVVLRGGFAFAGGTCSDLIEHVSAFRLSVRPGSTAQLALAELGAAYLDSVREEITAKEALVAQLSEQSPARNAATRAAIEAGVPSNKKK